MVHEVKMEVHSRDEARCVKLISEAKRCDDMRCIYRDDRDATVEQVTNKPLIKQHGSFIVSAPQ